MEPHSALHTESMVQNSGTWYENTGSKSLHHDHASGYPDGGQTYLKQGFQPTPVNGGHFHAGEAPGHSGHQHAQAHHHEQSHHQGHLESHRHQHHHEHSQEHAHSNESHGHQHAPNGGACQHDHGHSHNHSGQHDRHDHGQDHYGHGHDHHDHGHNHHSHGHDHHDHGHDYHSHGHDHHDHHHGHHSHHHIPRAHIKLLPSRSYIFSTLAPEEKTIFTWFLVQMVVGIWLYCIGSQNESLSITAFAYLILFDAIGVLNQFISKVISSNREFGEMNAKRPYGAQRYEIVFALATTIYLMFATMQNTKESLEHFLLESHHPGGAHEGAQHHSKAGFGTFFALFIAVATTYIASGEPIKNHEKFVNYLWRSQRMVNGSLYNVINPGRGGLRRGALWSNVFSFLITASGALLLMFHVLGFATPFMDKVLALGESIVMVYLGYPTAKSLANILLQTTPATVLNLVEARLHEIRQHPDIVTIDRVHFWQHTYGRYVGTLEVVVHDNADEQAVLQTVYGRLAGVTEELSVSIVKQ